VPSKVVNWLKQKINGVRQNGVAEEERRSKATSFKGGASSEKKLPLGGGVIGERRANRLPRRNRIKWKTSLRISLLTRDEGTLKKKDNEEIKNWFEGDSAK